MVRFEAYTETKIMIPCSTLLLILVTLVANLLAPGNATVQVWGLKASGLMGDPGNPPDPYIKVKCGGTFGGMTEFIRDSSYPVWRAEFNFPRCTVGNDLEIEVWDKDLVLDDFLGICVHRLARGYQGNVGCFLSKGKVSFSYSAN